jgi:hypothetical protein
MLVVFWSNEPGQTMANWWREIANRVVTAPSNAMREQLQPDTANGGRSFDLWNATQPLTMVADTTTAMRVNPFMLK